MASDWPEDLRIILNIICMHMNGAPCNFADSATASERIARIWGLYEDNGCQGLSSDEAQGDLEALKDHLALPANSLDSGDNTKLDTIIQSCWDG